MASLSEWVRQLVLLMFVIIAAQLLLPTDGMRPYVRFVLGLVVVSALLTSLFDLTDVDFEPDRLLAPPPSTHSGEAVAAAGLALADAARQRLASYEPEWTRQRTEQWVTALLGEPPRRVAVDTDGTGRVRSVTVVTGRLPAGEEAAAVRLLARLLDMDAEQVAVVQDEGGDGP